MSTITIPKEVDKNEDLIAIPRKEYQKFMRLFKILPKSQWWFWTKEWQKKEEEADRDIKLGKLSGPYRNSKELEKTLKKLKG